VYGWKNKCVKFEVYASIVIRAIAWLGAALGSDIHVIHLPRRSSWEAVLVDNLSRRSTSLRSERELINMFKNQKSLLRYQAGLCLRQLIGICHRELCQKL
jgi:hypothetical protein